MQERYCKFERAPFKSHAGWHDLHGLMINFATKIRDITFITLKRADEVQKGPIYHALIEVASKNSTLLFSPFSLSMLAVWICRFINSNPFTLMTRKFCNISWVSFPFPVLFFCHCYKAGATLVVIIMLVCVCDLSLIPLSKSLFSSSQPFINWSD